MPNVRCSVFSLITSQRSVNQQHKTSWFVIATVVIVIVVDVVFVKDAFVLIVELAKVIHVPRTTDLNIM